MNSLDPTQGTYSRSLWLGGEKDLVISWTGPKTWEPTSEFSVAWRLEMNASSNPSRVQDGTLTSDRPVQQINMLPVYDDPNIRNGSVELQSLNSPEISLWCDIPLGSTSFHQGILQSWRIPLPPPDPNSDLSPPDPFDPPVDNLGHRRLPWGGQIEPTTVLDFLWFDPPLNADEVVPFVAFADGGSAASGLPLVQDYADAIKNNPDPRQAYEAMQTAAASFITANWAAWTAAQTLALNLARTLDLIAALPGEPSFFEMDELVEKELGMTPAEFQQTQVDAKDGLFPLAWQLLYAIVIVTPAAISAPSQQEAVAATEFLARTARAMSLVCRLQRDDPALLLPEFRQRLPRALLVLPDGVTPPLPAAGADDVECLGVGVQKTINQRLKKYRLGEIAHVMNIMPGERLTLFDRDRSEARTRETTREQDDRREAHDERATSSSDLAQTLRDALAQAEVNRNYTNLNITAGTWPDLVANGSWWGWDGEQGRKLGRAARFVQGLSTEVANRMAKRVVQLRATATLREQESTQRRAIDNRRSITPVCGVYHWLEKVYELRMRSNGRHVVLEFLLSAPGDRLRKEAKAWPKLEPVLPPETWGISSEPDKYSTVTADNYASAAAAYGLSLPPPPPATIVVRAELASSSQSAGLVIPPGYQASAVSISYVVSDATLVLSAVVGTMPVTFTPTPVPAATSQTPATLSGATAPSGPPAIPNPQGYGWTTAVAGVGTGSVTLPARTSGELPLACQYAGTSFNLIVEAQCGAESAAALTAWQVATHGAIITGYDDARLAREGAVMAAVIALQATEGVRASDLAATHLERAGCARCRGTPALDRYACTRRTALSHRCTGLAAIDLRLLPVWGWRGPPAKPRALGRGNRHRPQRSSLAAELHAGRLCQDAGDSAARL